MTDLCNTSTHITHTRTYTHTHAHAQPLVFHLIIEKDWNLSQIYHPCFPVILSGSGSTAEVSTLWQRKLSYSKWRWHWLQAYPSINPIGMNVTKEEPSWDSKVRRNPMRMSPCSLKIFERRQRLMRWIQGFNCYYFTIQFHRKQRLSLIYSHRCALVSEPVLFCGKLPDINYSTSICFVDPKWFSKPSSSPVVAQRHSDGSVYSVIHSSVDTNYFDSNR